MIKIPRFFGKDYIEFLFRFCKNEQSLNVPVDIVYVWLEVVGNRSSWKSMVVEIENGIV